MYKTEFLIILIAFQLVRLVYLTLNKKSGKFLWISFFLVSVPFEFEKLISHFDPNAVTGTLGSTFKITIFSLLPFVLVPFVNWPKFKLSFDFYSWINLILILIFISVLNPFNQSLTATSYFAFFFVTHIILFQIFFNILSKAQLIKGVYDGLLILCIVQLVLAICFPLLGLNSVTYIFHDIAAEWATRLDSNRVGAVGLFNHPGNLALFIVLSSSFFLSTYLVDYKKKTSAFILAANTFTLFLTYSRTSYLTFVIVLLVLYYIYKNASRSIFSASTLLKLVLPSSLVLIWLIFFSPLSEQFIKSDTDMQYTNRLTHYLLALNIFKASPIVGVGLNSHLAFLASDQDVSSSITATGFYFANPIHNIHLIILAETGLLGFCLWLVFIFRSVGKAKEQIAHRQNQILPLTFIGAIITYCIYGLTGWTPFSAALLPFFLFVAFFTIKYNVRYR